MPSRSASSRAWALARTLKPMIAALEVAASVTSDSVMPPTPEWMMRARDLVGAERLERLGDRLDRALHVALDDQREDLLAGAPGAGSSSARASRGRRSGGPRLVALLAGAIVGDLAGAGLALDHREAVAGLGRALEAEHLDRRRRAGFLDLLAVIVDQRADAAPVGAGDDDVADPERAALDQDGRDRRRGPGRAWPRSPRLRRRGRDWP